MKMFIAAAGFRREHYLCNNVSINRAGPAGPPITKFSTKSRVHSVFFGQHATHPTSCNNVTKTINDCMITNDFSLLTILTSTQCRYVQTEVSLILDYVTMFFLSHH